MPHNFLDLSQEPGMEPCPKCLNGEPEEIVMGVCSWCGGFKYVHEDYNGPIDGSKIEHYEGKVLEDSINPDR